ncbi:MAG TPA: ABC transporter permease [Vitreimonas sp.]|nr:ABC transporter permease [Vitreimonas sp.]
MSGRHDPLLPNAAIVARREYAERVHSKLFHFSTLLLATLAVLVAFIPFLIRVADRNTVTTIVVASADEVLAERSIGILASVLNAGTSEGGQRPYRVQTADDAEAALRSVAAGDVDGALVVDRTPSGQLAFQFQAGDAVGEDRRQQLAIGAFAIAVLDYAASNPGAGGFQMPNVEQQTIGGPGAGPPVGAAEYASRRIVGVVFVVLIFITLVIYGMWVAAGVVSEKSSRVMEVMISAASARQLVVGKVVGIGLAGLTQAVAILIPALAALVLQDPLANAVLGPGASATPSLAALSVGLIAAFLVYFTLGFVLYALVYAAAGSMVSRAEDLQMLALPLSLVAIVGYVQAVMALTGGLAGFVRIASYVPFWSPFVMLTRLTVGRVEPWELVLSLALLVLTIGATYVVAVRIYAAGVLLYGQRPGLRAIAGAALGR